MSNRSLNDDVNRIVKRPRISKAKKITRARGINIPASVGVGVGSEETASGGAGIASPLTEVSRTVAPMTIWDVTGMVGITFNVADKITMVDANEREVVFDYA